MASRDRRKKASDVFNDATFVFSQKTDFATAFPTIKSVTVEVTESDYGNDKRRYWSPSQGEFIDCSNRLCYNGGVSVGAVLREMVRDSATEGEFNKLCQGYEGSPKGRRKYRDCLRMFTLKVRIEYQVSDDEAHDAAAE